MRFLSRVPRQLLVFGVTVAFLGSSWAALPLQAAPAAARPTINIAIVSDINTLDPAVSSSFYDRQIMNNIYDKLFDLNSKGRIIPDLATGYKVSKNGLTYTLTLRKGVKFQDGTPFNAAAVVFNLNRYRLPTSAPRATELALVKSVTAAGSDTVKIGLSAPFSPLISILTDRSGMMCSPTAVQSEGANYAAKPVGTGPFSLEERVKGDHITLVRNPNYWRKGYPKAQTVIFKIFTDPNTQLVNLQSGQVDFIDIVTSQNVPSVKGDSSLKLVNKPGFGWGGFWLNTAEPPFNNRLVREAVSALINRKQFVRATLGVTAIPSDSPYGPGEFAYGSFDKPPTQSVKIARQLMSKANASNVSFTFITTTAAISIQQAEIIQGMLQAGGISMKIETDDFPTILTRLSQHNFQAAAVGWSGRPDPDQNSYNHFVTGGPNNYGQYSSAVTDKYLNLGRKQTTTKERKVDYAKVAAQLAKDDPYIFLDHPNNAFGMTAKLKGFTYVPDGIIRTVAMTK